MPTSTPVVSRALLEQTFAPEIVQVLLERPELLAGRKAELSLLFADLRGFTALTEGLTPESCYELLSEVLNELTTIVLDHHGVLVDYYGDGLFALWNAPLETPEHAQLACEAAQAMLAALPRLNDRWVDRLPAALTLGIGVHTGEMQVGNAGTRQRFKYGPRGKNVHIASRIERATRQVGVSLLVSAATQRCLDDRFTALKACTAKLPGLSEPIDLFTVHSADGRALPEACAEHYECARKAFERGELEVAEQWLEEVDHGSTAIPAAFLADHVAALQRGRVGRRAGDDLSDREQAIIEILAK